MSLPNDLPQIKVDGIKADGHCTTGVHGFRHPFVGMEMRSFNDEQQTGRKGVPTEPEELLLGIAHLPAQHSAVLIEVSI